MRSKMRWASAVALAGSFATILFGAQGSGAIASEMIPVLVETKPEVQFVATPVVQPLPADEADSAAPGKDDGEAAAAYDSLSAAVDAADPAATLDNQMNCLAGAIYFEARGESLDGQLAVGRVIVNRANSGRFPASYCGVVYQPSQFSFVRGGRMPTIRRGSRDWRKAVAIARIADSGTMVSKAKGALFFHAARVSPGWRLTRLARVDNHIFYQ